MLLAFSDATLTVNLLFSSADLCKLCSSRRLVLPAWESFEERLKNPNTYVVFYDYFLRSATGDEEWKLRSSKNNDQSVSSSRLTPPLNEAFALVLLKNNFFAWLLEAKESYNSLITDYDNDDIGPNDKPLVEYLSQGAYIDLQDGNGNESFVLTPPAVAAAEGEEPSVASRRYEEAATLFHKKIKDVRDQVKDSADYKRVIESLEDLGGSDEVSKHERKKKKRKMVKELKLYTGMRVDNEKAFRGWSVRGYKVMSRYKTAIEQESEMYNRFDVAYRYLNDRQQEHSDEKKLTTTPSSSDSEDDSELNDLFDFRGT